MPALFSARHGHYDKAVNGVSENDPVDIIERFHKMNLEPLLEVIGQGIIVIPVVVREDERF